MPVRTDRCPHCLAALAANVGLACPHCRRSLVPTGRKARKAFEQERLARARRDNPGPQSAHPQQPHPPVVLSDAPPASVGSSSPDAVTPPPEASGWGAPTIPPPPAKRRSVLRTLGVILGVVVGFLVGSFVVGIALGVIGTNTEPVATVESAAYDGPTFSVRLPAPVNVQTIEEGGVTVKMYGYEAADGYVGVGVYPIPADQEFAGFQGTARAIAEESGGRIVSEQTLEVAGKPAIDLLMSGAEFSKTGTAWMRFIVDDAHLYALTGFRVGDHTEPPPAYVTARDSFVMR